MPHPTGPDDDALVAAWLAGDREMLHLLLERHSPPLFRLAYRLTGNREDAEDLVQETFARMLGSIGRYRSSGRFAAWLRTILVRLSLDLARRAHPSAAFREPLDPAPGPEDTALEREAAERLRVELGTLPPGYRAVLVLLNGEGLSVSEVATTLRLSPSVVKNRAFRARRMLRESLNRCTKEAHGDGRTAQSTGFGFPGRQPGNGGLR